MSVVWGREECAFEPEHHCGFNQTGDGLHRAIVHALKTLHSGESEILSNRGETSLREGVLSIGG